MGGRIKKLKKIKKIKSKQPGNHVILNIYFKEFPLAFESVSFGEKFFRQAIKKGGFKILKTGFYKFKPQGVTGFFLLSESHLSFHTWPEENYVAIDLFTCSDTLSTKRSLNYIIKEIKKYKVKKIDQQLIRRGFVYQG